MSLAAGFTRFTPIQTSQPFAQIVLPDGEFGAFDLEIIVRDDGVMGEGQSALFTNVSFGGVTSVPEAGAVATMSMLTLGLLWSHRRPARSSTMLAQ